MHEDFMITHAVDKNQKKDLRVLVASAYVHQGYISENDEHLMYSPHYDGDDGVRFVAKEQSGRTVGTIAIVVDSSAELPMDALYHDELLALRKRGLRIAEAGQFAIPQDISLFKRLRVVQQLFAAVISELKTQMVDVIVITVNPKHDSVYSTLGFSTFGDTKPYSAVGGAPAVPKLKYLEKEIKSLPPKNKKGGSPQT